jgi:hypothetical protein
LANGERSELWIEFVGFGLSVFSHVSLKDEVDDDFASGIIMVRLEFFVALVELFADVTVYLSAIPPMYDPTWDIEKLEGIDVAIGLQPPDLTEHVVGQSVVTVLGSQLCVTARVSVNPYIGIGMYRTVLPIISIVNRRVTVSRQNCSLLRARPLKVSA